MSRSTKPAKPYIVVFCEGESEQAYTDFLRKEFKDVASIHRPKATGLLMLQTVNTRRIQNIGTTRRSQTKSGSSLM